MCPIFFHIDVNSAFLSWTATENLRNGSAEDLRTIPSIIGGDMEKRHGVVLAKSIPAKKYKIQTGEPIVNALRKYPALVVAAPNHDLYSTYSKKLFHYLSNICPDIEQVSIDECYMDFTPISRKYASPVDAATSIKDHIYAEFGFTVNIGISDRKVLAKMASDFKKPNLVHTLYHSEIAEKMWHLPVSELYMCGKSSVDCLHNLGILTIGDLAKSDVGIIEMHLKSHGRLLWEYANGMDDSRVETTRSELKGVGNSITLQKDVTDVKEARRVLLHLAESVGSRLRRQERLATMISVEIKYNTFQSVSHQMTLGTATDSTRLIYENACQLFDELWNQTPVRLLGIRTSKLISVQEPVQMNLFDYQSQCGKSEKQKQLDQTIDTIREKFGASSITRCSLLKAKDDFKKH
ncbi:MAG: DNA polymerase IV [Lachnospiraceae bacterium]|nr:DNA polymerase IV [Lachnospiraceae bacterium]